MSAAACLPITHCIKKKRLLPLTAVKSLPRFAKTQKLGVGLKTPNVRRQVKPLTPVTPHPARIVINSSHNNSGSNSNSGTHNNQSHVTNAFLWYYIGSQAGRNGSIPAVGSSLTGGSTSRPSSGTVYSGVSSKGGGFESSYRSAKKTSTVAGGKVTSTTSGGKSSSAKSGSNPGSRVGSNKSGSNSGGSKSGSNSGSKSGGSKGGFGGGSKSGGGTSGRARTQPLSKLHHYPFMSERTPATRRIPRPPPGVGNRH